MDRRETAARCPKRQRDHGNKAWTASNLTFFNEDCNKRQPIGCKVSTVGGEKYYGNIEKLHTDVSYGKIILFIRAPEYLCVM